MQCLLQPSSLLQLHARLNPQKQHKPPHSTKLSWLTCTDELSRISVPKIHHLRTKALPFSIVVAAATTAPAKSGDISVFLPVSVLLLSFYFISNFIVPEMITKNSGSDNVSEDQKVDDLNAREDK